MEIDQEVDGNQIVPNTDKMAIEDCANPVGSYATMTNPKIVLFDEYWKRLEAVVMSVMNAEAVDQTVWSNSFFDIYGLCTGQYTVDLYAKLIEFFKERVHAIAKNLSPLKGIDLLQTYSANWNQFDMGVNYTNDLCRYLNRMIIKDTNARTFSRKYPELEELLGGKRLEICDAARRLWRKELIIPLKNRLYDVIWGNFIETRNASYVQSPNSAVKKILDSFISVCFSSDEERDTILAALDPALCVKHNYPIPAQLNFYIEIFEDRFLMDNRKHFRTLLSETLVHYNMYDYMSKVIKILENEESLASHLLFNPTVKKLSVLLRKIFILEQLGRFDEVVPEYVRMEKKAELRLVYILLDYFPDAAQILVLEYEKQVTNSLENHFSGLFLTPSVFTEAACAKHTFYTKFNKEVFSDASYIQGAMRRAIENVVNKERDGEKFYGAKMLARHMDLLLKKNTKNKVVDIDAKLDEAVTIFRYIKDKDTFHKLRALTEMIPALSEFTNVVDLVIAQPLDMNRLLKMDPVVTDFLNRQHVWLIFEIFQRMFAIRLLNKISLSLELEQQMIEKLRDTCGNEYACKLTRMYQDCSKSRQLNTDFHANEEFHNHPYNSENEFTIIQTCAWPVISSSEDPALKNLHIPQPLQVFSDVVKEYYETRHNGRILKYAYHVSTADILIKLGSKRCTATMTVPQAMLLLEFEKNDIKTINELVDTTKMSFEYVCSSLKALIDFKVLKVEEKKECFTQETPIHVNSEFEALRARVHLQPPTIVSKANENNPMPSARETLQDRKVAVECAIVRAMKTRKVMKHQDLIDWVITSIADRFVPDRPFLKQCVEGLIEKHFLQRTDNIDEYEYLP